MSDDGPGVAMLVSLSGDGGGDEEEPRFLEFITEVRAPGSPRDSVLFSILFYTVLPGARVMEHERIACARKNALSCWLLADAVVERMRDSPTTAPCELRLTPLHRDHGAQILALFARLTTLEVTLERGVGDAPYTLRCSRGDGPLPGAARLLELCPG